MSISDKLATIAENEQKVFDAGKQEQYDAFWDAIQANGNIYKYSQTFCNFNYTNTSMVYGNWTADTFKPKYPIAPKECDGYPLFAGLKIADFKKHCEDNNIVIDTSAVANLGNFYRYLLSATLPDIDASNCTKLSSCFYHCTELVESPNILNGELIETLYGLYSECVKVKHIPTIWVVAEPASNAFEGAFVACRALETIGEIKGSFKNTVNFRWSPLLTTETLLKILTALSKDATYASRKTLTLNTASQAVIEADTACSEQLASAVSAGWTIAYA